MTSGRVRQHQQDDAVKGCPVLLSNHVRGKEVGTGGGGGGGGLGGDGC